MKQVTTSLCQTLPNNPVEKPLSPTENSNTTHRTMGTEGGVKVKVSTNSVEQPANDNIIDNYDTDELITEIFSLW